MEATIAPNGRPVFKLTTPSGATGYVDASVADLPAAALAEWQRQLLLRLLANILERRALDLAN
jgi:hypothetical protein